MIDNGVFRLAGTWQPKIGTRFKFHFLSQPNEDVPIHNPQSSFYYKLKNKNLASFWQDNQHKKEKRNLLGERKWKK